MTARETEGMVSRLISNVPQQKLERSALSFGANVVESKENIGRQFHSVGRRVREIVPSEKRILFSKMEVLKYLILFYSFSLRTLFCIIIPIVLTATRISLLVIFRLSSNFFT